jgi:hypothetical protein
MIVAQHSRQVQSYGVFWQSWIAYPYYILILIEASSDVASCADAVMLLSQVERKLKIRGVVQRLKQQYRGNRTNWNGQQMIKKISNVWSLTSPNFISVFRLEQPLLYGAFGRRRDAFLRNCQAFVVHASWRLQIESDSETGSQCVQINPISTTSYSKA